MINNLEVRGDNESLLLKMKLYLSPKQTNIKRELYNVLMLMSEFGGFIKLVNETLF